MKCKYCNAPITLEDEFCPYCGALNEQARQHIQDMKQYRVDYEQTRRTVLDQADRQSRRHGRVFLLVALAVLNLICIGLWFNSYELTYFLQERAVNRQAENYRNKLLDLETEGRYRELELVYNRNNLYSCKALQEFRTVTDFAREYTEIVDEIYYLNHEEARSWYSRGQELERLAESVARCYEIGTWNGSSYYEQDFQEPHRSAMQNMTDVIEDLLMSQCSLTEADLLTIREMESQDLMILIGRRMGIYE